MKIVLSYTSPTCSGRGTETLLRFGGGVSCFLTTRINAASFAVLCDAIYIADTLTAEDTSCLTNPPLPRIQKSSLDRAS